MKKNKNKIIDTKIFNKNPYDIKIEYHFDDIHFLYNNATISMFIGTNLAVENFMNKPIEDMPLHVNDIITIEGINLSTPSRAMAWYRLHINK